MNGNGTGRYTIDKDFVEPPNPSHDSDAPRSLGGTQETRDNHGREDGCAGMTPLDDQLGHLLRRAHQRASATMATALNGVHLTPAQYFAMARLRERGELSQNLLGRLSAMDPATIQGVIQRLGARGFIERRADPTDRRRMLLCLTPSGRAIVDKLYGAVTAASEQITASLAKEEQTQLILLLKMIV